MKIRIGIIISLSVVIFVLAMNLFFDGGSSPSSKSQISTFSDCVADGNPVMESYPRQCRTTDGILFVEDIQTSDSHQARAIEPGLTIQSAQTIAKASTQCTNEGEIGSFEVYNPNSGTWWFSLEADKQGCSPACVVYDQTKEAEINWRCTGALGF